MISHSRPGSHWETPRSFATTWRFRPKLPSPAATRDSSNATFRAWSIPPSAGSPTCAASKTNASARINRQSSHDPAAHDLVIRAVDANVLPVTQVPAVLGEWRVPSHEEFAVDGKTVWRFHNAMTHVWKGRIWPPCPAARNRFTAFWMLSAVWRSRTIQRFCGGLIA